MNEADPRLLEEYTIWPSNICTPDPAVTQAELDANCPWSSDCCVATAQDCAAACNELGSCVAFRFFLPDVRGGNCIFDKTGLLRPCKVFGSCVVSEGSCQPKFNSSDYSVLDYYERTTQCQAVSPPPPQPMPPPPRRPPPRAPPLPPPRPSSPPLHPPSGSNRTTLIACIAVAGSTLLCALVIWRVLRARRRSAGADSTALADELLGETAAVAAHTSSFSFDIFLSYRRSDFALTDLLSALLENEQVRVFKDRDGHIAGRPFDQALCLAIMLSATFSPVVTLEGTQALMGVTSATVDYVLVEYILALHFRLTCRIQRIYPLLVGVQSREPGGTHVRMDILSENSDWRDARSALPHTVPQACIEVASALHRHVVKEELLPCLRKATVWQLLCASAASEGEEGDSTLRQGILTHDWCLLNGLQQDMALLVKGRFAANLKKPYFADLPVETAEPAREIDVVP